MVKSSILATEANCQIVMGMSPCGIAVGWPGVRIDGRQTIDQPARLAAGGAMTGT
jgi:hypothetical protein